MTDKETLVDFSAIVVIGARQDDLRRLVREYWDALAATDYRVELIAVLDGPRPAAMEALEALRGDGIDLKIVELSRPFGEATALMVGFDNSRGHTILTLPAYFQIEPADLEMLMRESESQDVTLTHRNPRRGGWFERTRRRAFHGLLSAITGHRFHDLGCSVRCIKRRVFNELRLYGDQHRLLAVLARNSGFSVAEIRVRQSPLDEYRSRYRIREYLHRLLDVFTVFFLVRFTKKPLRFFGMIGSIIFIVGGLVLSILVVERLFMGVALADRPAMLLSSLLVVLGLQLFSIGLLGELIIFTHAKSLKEYKIERIIGGESTQE